MASYAELIKWTKAKHGFSPKTCWIAHVKADSGLPMRAAPNRRDQNRREQPCPPNRRPAIMDALKHFKMI